jgi:hypothetical protein
MSAGFVLTPGGRARFPPLAEISPGELSGVARRLRVLRDRGIASPPGDDMDSDDSPATARVRGRRALATIGRIAAEWDELPVPWPEVFSLRWEAYLAGTIPVGAVVVDETGEVVSRARNRTFDDPRNGHLGGSRLAHAKVNALVALTSERTYEGFTLYTAFEPCHLCLSAAGSSSHSAKRRSYRGRRVNLPFKRLCAPTDELR